MWIALLAWAPGLAAAAEPAEVELLVWRSRAALAVRDPEASVAHAAEALDAAPASPAALWAWSEALDAVGGGAQLAHEAAVLAEDPDPFRAWVGRAWQSAEVQQVPPVVSELPATRAFAARLALEQARPQRALDLVLDLSGTAAAGLRLAALEDLGRDREALVQARDLGGDGGAWLAPVCDLDGRGAGAAQRRLVAQAAEQLSSSEPVALYQAHALLVACGETALAEAASARLVAVGEPHQLGGRHPWGGPMIRDLGRVLAMQDSPRLPEGGTPAEDQRILVATARELQERGRTEESVALWREAMALHEPPPALALEAAGVALARGETATAQALVTSARASLARQAVDPGELARQRRLHADAWRLQARLFQAAPDTVVGLTALEAAAAAALTAERPQDLVLLGELLELQGHARAALQAYARAAALGQRGLGPRLTRLYGGPASPEAAIAAWRDTLAQDPRPRAVEEARGARLPARTLSTTAGPLRIGDGGEQWLVVNFWASWCGPCQRELPELAELGAAIEAEGLPVRIVAVSVDDRRGDYEAWISDRDTGGLVLAWDPDLGRALQLRSIPTTLLVDPSGLVQETRRGYRPGDGERLLADLRPHLEPKTGD